MAKRPIDMTEKELFAVGRGSTPGQMLVFMHRLRKDVEAKMAADEVGEKSAGVEDALQREFGMNRREHGLNQTCVGCTKPKGEFKDEASEREYKISLLCQACQDVAFDD